MKQGPPRRTEYSEILKPAPVLIQKVYFLVELQHGGIGCGKAPACCHLFPGSDFHRFAGINQFGRIIQNLTFQAAGSQNKRDEQTKPQCFFPMQPKIHLPEKSGCGWECNKPIQAEAQGKQFYESLFRGK